MGTEGGSDVTGALVRTILCATLAITLLSLALAQPHELESMESDEWHIHRVDSEHLVGGYSSLAIDSLNRPHISYEDSWNLGVKYAHWTGTEWSVESVDFVGGNPYTSMCLDNNDQPRFAYVKKGAALHYNLMYALWNGTDWQFESVDFVGTHGGYEVSMALDSQDRPHISYHHFNDEILKYAHKNESGWNVETVDSSRDVGRFSSIDVDSIDYPHISYFDDTHEDLKYARWNGSAWNTETVDSHHTVGLYTSIAVDSSDNPRIAYLDASPYTHLSHAYFDGTLWILETVDPARQVGFDASIALDSNDYSHISYHDNVNNSLRYAVQTGRGWSIETVDDEGIVGTGASIAVDSDDLPHVSYLDGGNNDLKYAAKAELTPSSRSITLDIDPDTLSLKSKGRWITAYLSAENASVYDIDISSILLQDALLPERWDYQDDVLMLKFNREEFKDTVQVGESVQVRIAGGWEDGPAFEAFDSIRVFNPGRR